MQAAQCLRDIGLALMRLSRPLEALEQLRSAAALAPRLPHLYSNLGLTLQALGRMQEAAEALQTAVEVDGAANANAHAALGVLLASFGQSSDAAKHLKMALHIEPTHANAAKHLEDQEEQLKKMDLKMALHIEPTHANAAKHLEDQEEQLKKMRTTLTGKKGTSRTGQVTGGR
eukprot:CAMPEP_0198229412 /NCGR_PEP_ID=MMETSP1445-20131203/114113_1 /TAXON_ID=36898 /ORGANISM="Pyramimonas sp., Strain CCMP2087" /LENGTH=172 /DNA_ID=CAMNT_0043909875 /DNA_START=208 /DNA_END=728 /DNA_ORIENTATION=-